MGAAQWVKLHLLKTFCTTVYGTFQDSCQEATFTSTYKLKEN
jgi:hypothetical protein